jgi:uncharacterized protein involved in type VI secretion and phage assembly
MNLLDLLPSEMAYETHLGKIYGVVIGIVTNNQDEENLGRIKVRFPWLVEDDESHWARVATLMAGPDRGSFFLPEVDDEVLVAFDHGDVRFPYVIGALWNGKDKPPYDNADGANNLRAIKSRSKHQIILDDTDGAEKIEIIDATGNNSLTIDSSANTMTLEVEGDIVLRAAKGKIVLDAQSVEITSSQSTKVQAGSTMEVTARQTMTVKGQTVHIN